MDHAYVSKLYQMKKYSDIKRLAIQAIKQDKFNSQYWVYLLESLIAMKKLSDAHHAYKRAVILDPAASWVDTYSQKVQGVRVEEPSSWLSELLDFPQVSVSAAMIVKNGSRTIEKALQNLIPAVDEIIVVDTGSTDNTVAIIESFGITVHHFEWCDDFSAARNHALSLVTKDWVLWVDSDEILLEEDVTVPRAIAGMMTSVEDPIMLRIVQLNQMPQGVVPDYSMFRFFPTGRGIKFWGKIHEQPSTHALDLKSKIDIQVGLVGIRVFHDGYNEQVIDLKEKMLRNISLLEKNVSENPEDIGSLGFLGREYYNSGEYEKAIESFYKAEAILDNFPAYARIAGDRYLLCNLLVSLGRIDEAYKVAKRSVDYNPDFPGAWYSLAQVELLLGARNLRSARQHFVKVKETSDLYRGVVSVDPSIASWRSDLGIADASRMNGDLAEARDIYNAVLSKYPDFKLVRQQLQMIEGQRVKLGTKKY